MIGFTKIDYWVNITIKVQFLNNIQQLTMNRVIRYFSVLNKINKKNGFRQKLRQGDNYLRAQTHVIPHVPTLTSPLTTEQLSPYQQYLIDNHALQRPFTGKLWHQMSPGFYNCVVCDTRLFTFNHKFDSGTGYATFWGALKGTVKTDEQEVLFDQVNEMRSKHKSHNQTHKRCFCEKCNSHLGAVFVDGPPPSFLRYTINSVMLKFYDFPDFQNPHLRIKQKRSECRKKSIFYLQ